MSIIALKKKDMPIEEIMFIDCLANSIDHKTTACAKEQDFYEFAINKKHIDLDKWIILRAEDSNIGFMFTKEGFYMSCSPQNGTEPEIKKALKSLGFKKFYVFVKCLNSNLRDYLFNL